MTLKQGSYQDAPIINNSISPNFAYAGHTSWNHTRTHSHPQFHHPKSGARAPRSCTFHSFTIIWSLHYSTVFTGWVGSTTDEFRLEVALNKCQISITDQPHSISAKTTIFEKTVFGNTITESGDVTWKESRYVLECDDWDVECVTETNETSSLHRCIDIKTSCTHQSFLITHQYIFNPMAHGSLVSNAFSFAFFSCLGVFRSSKRLP